MSLKCTLSYTTALTVVLFSVSANAQTTVDDKRTSPISTSSAGNITITKDGEVNTSSGSAVTVDSNNNVSSKGKIDAASEDGAIGIEIEAGTQSTIDNEGDINVTEDFQPEDDNNDRIVDGSFANASNRFGIFVAPGPLTSGSITNSGDITVEGNQSGGIVIGAPYRGNIHTSGDITVIGDDSFGVRMQDVDGNVLIRGKVKVAGRRSIAVAADGDISGTLTLQGEISQEASYKTDNDTVLRLQRDDFRLGAPAVRVAGNVAGGIIIARPPKDTDADDKDEDNDGIPDAEEGRGVITSIGNGPALLIGGATDTVIGTVPGVSGGYSIVNDGAITGKSGISATDAYGAVIGGQGGNVDVAGGILNTGVLRATTVSKSATALLIKEGSTVKRLANDGTIGVGITTGGDGILYAIHDQSGTLTSIENTGFITVTGTSEDLARAIYLENTTAGVTIVQKLSAEDIAARKEKEEESGETDTTVYAAITGDIVLGSGDDVLDIQDGRVTGDTFFNDGNDTLRLSGRADYRGTVDFGEGVGTMTMADTSKFTGRLDTSNLEATLTIAGEAQFRGSIIDGANLTVNVNGGSFAARDAKTNTIHALNVGAEGTYSAVINSNSKESSLLIVDTATFAEGANVSAIISSLEDVEGTYTILRANDSITGLPTIDTENGFLPFILSGSIAQSGLDLNLTIARKKADELNLKRSASETYEAFYETSRNSKALSASLLAISSSDELQGQIDKFMPDHAGGIFHLVTQGSRTTTRHLSDPHWMYDVTEVGAWLEPITWNSKKDAGDTVSFSTEGWGISGGVERWSKLGYLGLSYSYLSGSVDNNGGTGSVDVAQHEVGGYWRLQEGPLLAYAKGSWAYLSMKSARTITGTEDGPKIAGQADAKWNGWLFSSKAGALLDFKIVERMSLKPKVAIEYFNLDEDGYSETAKNDALALEVDSRSSNAFSGEASVILAYEIGRKRWQNQPLTFELEGGRRENFSGSLGDTTANFDDGDEFTIKGDDLPSAFFGEARLLVGGDDHTWLISGRAERRFGNYEYSLRASLSAAF